VEIADAHEQVNVFLGIVFENGCALERSPECLDRILPAPGGIEGESQVDQCPHAQERVLRLMW
jgi:hypothetical protein